MTVLTNPRLLIELIEPEQKTTTEPVKSRPIRVTKKMLARQERLIGSQPEDLEEQRRNTVADSIAFRWQHRGDGMDAVADARRLITEELVSHYGMSEKDIHSMRLIYSTSRRVRYGMKANDVGVGHLPDKEHPYYRIFNIRTGEWVQVPSTSTCVNEM